MPMIGRRIRQLRVQKGLSQGDVEKASGLVRCYVSRVENGYIVPSLETLERFAGALGVPFHELFRDGKLDRAPRHVPGRTREGSYDGVTHFEAEDSILRKLRRVAGKLTEADRVLIVEFARKLSSLARKGTRRGGGRTQPRPAHPPRADSV